MGRSIKGLFMARKAASTRVNNMYVRQMSDVKLSFRSYFMIVARQPDLIGAQILAIGLEDIAAIEFFCKRSLVAVLLPGEALRLGLILHLEIACHARVALLEPPDRFVDLRAIF